MSENSFFPENTTEALAMLWLNHQDLAGKSPTEVHEMYWRAYYEISKAHTEKRDSGFFRELKE